MGRRSSRKSKPRRVLIAVLATMLALGLVGTASVAMNYEWLRAQYLRYVTLDFEGPGVGEVVIRIETGDDGVIVANKLFEAGVVKDVESFYRLLIEQNPTFYPGSYLMKKQMSNQNALEAIANPSNVLTYKITIPEGYRAVQIFEEIEKISGIPKSEVAKAAEDLFGLGVPEVAPTIEGYLFPATYSFDPSATAKDILKSMVDRMYQELESLGVPESDQHRILTLASIIQREGKAEADFYKISRVFYNRLEIDMKLETDPTISYNYDGSDMSERSKEDQIAYGYNTYLLNGLPPGPISSPGSLALDAALNPAKGEWLFFVTIDLRSGETKFSKTFAQHEEYVKQLRQWERENPGWYDN